MNDIESILKETRVFPPPPDFSAKAHVKSLDEYRALYRRSIEEPDAFWAEQAETLVWRKRWTKVLEWNAPWAKWFVGATLNLTESCLDRHVATWRKNKAAIIWEGEPGDTRVLTYQELLNEVCKFANVLKGLGVETGDRVGIYMPMIPEAAVAMLACARLGATHSVVFGGFSAEAVRDRMNDAQAKVVITADGGYRRGAIVALKANVDAGLDGVPTVTKVVVVRRTGQDVPMKAGRDVWWHEQMAGASTRFEPVAVDAEHPLFILYTSGTTGKPKGVVHSTGGYLLQTALTTKYFFDIKEEDTYWCTADIGWVTGHSYVVYGPLANGATTVMYEGAPNFPGFDRFWSIIDRHKVNIFYTAPTAIRAFIKWGDEHPKKHDLSSLRLLGTVGEPINPEAWMWYQSLIGGGRCPIIDTWWQTETGAIMISPLPGPPPPSPDRARCRSSAWSPRSSIVTASRCPRAPAGSSSSRSPGRPCCAPSIVIRTVTSSSIGSAIPASTSRATARDAMPTVTSGSWVASTMSSTWPAIAWAPWRSRARSSPTRRWRRRPWWGSPTS
jgi:acetyl-CoA synthetase